MFKNHADRVREYIRDPSIGYRKWRKSGRAHALRYQCEQDSKSKAHGDELKG